MYEKITLSNLKDGALEELFQYELAKVLDNIADANTEIRKKRTISIQIEMTPNDDASSVATVFTVKSTLVPIKSKACILALPSIGEQAGLFQETSREIPLMQNKEDSILMKDIINGGIKWAILLKRQLIF